MPEGRRVVGGWGSQEEERLNEVSRYEEKQKNMRCKKVGRGQKKKK